MEFDIEILQWIKVDNREYKGSKPSPQDWADTLKEDPDFYDKFGRVFNNADIPEAD